MTNKQRVWLEEYLKCWNATEAARRAGYAFPNVEGPKNLVNPSLKEEISARIEETKMSADEVLLRLAEQARGDIGDYAYVSNSSDLANHPASRIVKKFKKKIWYDKDGEPHEEIELELYDSQSPLLNLGKHLGLFNDKVEHEHTGQVDVKVIGGVSLDDV